MTGGSARQATTPQQRISPPTTHQTRKCLVPKQISLSKIQLKKPDSSIIPEIMPSYKIVVFGGKHSSIAVSRFTHTERRLIGDHCGPEVIKEAVKVRSTVELLMCQNNNKIDSRRHCGKQP